MDQPCIPNYGNTPHENNLVYGFRIYGDNLEECVKFGDMIIEASQTLGFDLIDIHNQFSGPIYRLSLSIDDFPELKLVLAYHICGRYGEWDPSRRPFIGHEATDVILTYVNQASDQGSPILALEFNDAIPAGNNAWQRFPRISQAAEAGIPFIYGLPICDAEVFDGEIRSIRHPNISIPLGQLALMGRFGVPSLSVYSESPWYLNAVEKGLAQEGVSGADAENLIGAYSIYQCLFAITADFPHVPGAFIERIKEWEKQILQDALEDMFKQISFFIPSDFPLLDNHSLANPESNNALSEIWLNRISNEIEIPNEYAFYNWNVDLIRTSIFPFGKATSTTSIFKDQLNPNLRLLSTASKMEVVEYAREWGIDIQDSSTKANAIRLIKEGPQRSYKPLSYKTPANEVAFIFNTSKFSELLEQSYPNLDRNIIAHCLHSTPPLLFLPIAGYVEDSGGVIAFSRPDKGLVGLVRSLFYTNDIFQDRVILMYHQEIPLTWRQQLENALLELRGQEATRSPNNLWRETARLATVVIIDHLQEGWIAE